MVVEKGKIFEGFVVLPTLSLNWMQLNDRTLYNLQCAFLFWFIGVSWERLNK